MKANAAKEAYEAWFRETQPIGQSATQIIEVRRAFYSGMGATMFLPMESETDAEQLSQELKAFFEEEVKTGYGLPPKES